ncbi:hypothetical protein FGG79_04055 [Bacillus sp. BHET2]|uniref:bifunctional adenosylcobinamide kinase/adenosylcobinamide-phosphate guanylyltransferase n=1 Tax=Bacillus sp. BHET2 TaxID=2583818 RepID=UPI00110F418C|nr:bifunctional adenosylcobinamide kinase/adenosylcobinamide-phosphate guanylyltransferase [Bacillus sp. BHET2]TMU87310.1 hypothetical protein FGG79_04055 [Bacillus sp. BHET2]
MYFITGGSFNGKSRWVKKQFNLIESETTWISLFDNEMEDITTIRPIIVLEGVEYAVRSSILHSGVDSKALFKEQIDSLREWEEGSPERKVIWIGSEIGKGIVPIDQSSREWRDMTGWVYQDLAEKSQQVWLVWYGLASSIKG